MGIGSRLLHSCDSAGCGGWLPWAQGMCRASQNDLEKHATSRANLHLDEAIEQASRQTSRYTTDTSHKALCFACVFGSRRILQRCLVVLIHHRKAAIDATASSSCICQAISTMLAQYKLVLHAEMCMCQHVVAIAR